MIQFNDNKAGMTGLNKEHIQRVMNENTSESFGLHAKQKEEKMAEEQKQIRDKVAKLSEAERLKLEEEMDAVTTSLEKERDFSRDCVHVDMDAFFAAVEMRDDARLREVPIAVGSTAMLSTSNYHARQFGVRAAMPGFIALKLCPSLTIIPGNYDKYSRESRVFCSILLEYDEDVSMSSLDEAYLDITHYMSTRTTPQRQKRIRYSGDCQCRLPRVRESDEKGEEESESTLPCPSCLLPRTLHTDFIHFGTSRSEVVREMRFRVEQSTGLSCSAGIACNFTLAKICSDKRKPNGQFELKNDEECVKEFLKDLPIRKVCGIGRVAEGRLNAVGVSVVGDMLPLRSLLTLAFSPLACRDMLAVGMGVGRNEHSAQERAERKSMSVERSFSPTSSADTLMDTLKEVCTTLAGQAVLGGVRSAAGFGVKMKLSTFDVITRCSAIPQGANVLDEDVMFSLASPIVLQQVNEGTSIRLLGVRIHKLSHTQQQPTEKEDILSLLRRGVKRRREEGREEEGKEEKEEEVQTAAGEGEPSCPICARSMQGMDDGMINKHVDECLNADAIKELSQQSQTPITPRSKGKKVQTKLDAFFKSGK